MSRTSYSYNKLPGLGNVRCSLFGLIPLGERKRGTRRFKVTLYCGINTCFQDLHLTLILRWFVPFYFISFSFILFLELGMVEGCWFDSVGFFLALFVYIFIYLFK